MINSNLYTEQYFTGFSRAAAWRRYVARLFDMAFYSIVLVYIFSMLIAVIDNTILDSIAQWEQNNPKADIIERPCVQLLTCIVIIPINYLIFGQTLGKKLLGIIVVTNTGNKLSYGTALEREVQVFFKGLLFMIFSFIYQYFAFKKNNSLSWDRNLNLKVYYRNYSNINIFIRYIIALTIMIFLFAINY
jgi:uncharacterized RDD family membrane protein YckC